jgi:hypothetical protein
VRRGEETESIAWALPCAKFRSFTMCSRRSAGKLSALAVQPVTSIVMLLQPPTTELRCERVAHQRFKTLVANRPNIKDAIVPSVIPVQRLGSGRHELVPASVVRLSTGHLNMAMTVVIEKSTNSMIRSWFECKNEALVGHNHPIPMSHPGGIRGGIRNYHAIKCFQRTSKIFYQDHRTGYFCLTR